MQEEAMAKAANTVPRVINILFKNCKYIFIVYEFRIIF